MVWELSVGGCEKRNQAKFRALTCFYVWLFLERHEGGKWKCCWSLPSGQPRNHCTFGVCVFAHQVLPLGRSLLIRRPWPLFSLLRGTSFGNPARGGFSIFWVSLPHPSAGHLSAHTVLRALMRLSSWRLVWGPLVLHSSCARHPGPAQAVSAGRACGWATSPRCFGGSRGPSCCDFDSTLAPNQSMEL